MMLRLLIVRHGETEWNAQRRYQGQSDVPLSDAGRAQARALVGRLARETLAAAYVSDLGRAVETAEILLAGRDVPLVKEARLREMNFGVLEGLTFKDAYARYPAEIDAWLKDYNTPPPGGEDLDSFAARVASLLDELQANHDEQVILLVAHGGPLSELARLALGMPHTRRWSFVMDNAGLSELQFNDGFPRVKFWNETCHFAG